MKKNFTFISLLLIISFAGYANSWYPQEMKAENIKSYFQKIQKINQINLLKSTEGVVKYKLDSIVAEHGAKESYIYNSSGKIVVKTTYSRDDGTSVWIGEDKEEYSYDESGNILQIIYYEWDAAANDWLNSIKTDISYDSNQRQSMWIMSQWDTTTNTWGIQLKFEATYVSDGINLSQTLIYYWNAGTSSWLDGGGADYTYDANGYLILEVENYFGVKSKYEYSYDTNGYLTTELEYNWDDGISDWVIIFKYEYSYNTDGKDQEEIIYEWNADDSEWNADEKNQYIYDADGNMSEEVAMYWEGDSWANSAKEEYICNNNYALSDLVLPPACEICANQIHMVEEVKYYSWSDYSDSWDYGGNTLAYYSDHDMTAVSEFNGGTINIFPNPVTDFVTVTIQNSSEPAQFKLFDIQGHKLMDKEIYNNQSVSLKELSEGFYFYNISAGGEKISGKLVKQ